ncbi:MAG: tetratricopeptide repeat protein [Mucispirillum sp.]|uniref:Tetratricopeptide repeat protein n=1 Tax=Candidatus Mucispirillum faecigallinarum TaxID=2838699 RepID=A0A9D2GU30_9BACT|nr:tetratricopeptide repeat protein [Mucispirillum sp.]HIZ88720.1 tetratricopeptide repeat protein [Candidatus Mucispirillum faecigallinarum]
MTNEELVAKTESLYDNGEYNQIISLIQSLPKEQQTYPLLFMLALAYSDNIDGDDEENKRQALKILKQISDSGEYDIKWLYLIGKTYFETNQEEYAIEYFNRINRIYQKDKEIASLMNVQHFIESCNEVLYERALAVIFITLKEASKDDNITINNISENKLAIFFPKYNIKLNMEIYNLHRSGAKLLFEIIYPDNYTQKYDIDGDANTYENGISDALNKFVNIINHEFSKHCK